MPFLVEPVVAESRPEARPGVRRCTDADRVFQPGAGAQHNADRYPAVLGLFVEGNDVDAAEVAAVEQRGARTDQLVSVERRAFLEVQEPGDEFRVDEVLLLPDFTEIVTGAAGQAQRDVGRGFGRPDVEPCRTECRFDIAAVGGEHLEILLQAFIV